MTVPAELPPKHQLVILSAAMQFDLSDPKTLAEFGGGAALLSHAVFQKWEPPVTGTVFASLVSLVAGPLVFALYLEQSLSQALLSATILNTSYITVLFTSIAFYRLFLHPLRRFPGPRMAALTKWWQVTLVAEGHTPRAIAALHAKHGDIVRIGPNELSIRDAAAIPQILGLAGKMEKGPWYLGSFAKKGQSVHAIRDIKSHAQRRRYWDRAFSGKALGEYAYFVKNCGDEWIAQLEKRADTGKAVNMADWCSFVAFDIMGWLGFGDSFGMLAAGTPHFYMKFVESAMKGLATFSEVPWIMPLLSSLPAGKDQEDMYNFSMETTLKRKERGTGGRPDVFHYLVGEDQPKQADLTIYELDADIRTVIIAGSDTVASTMTFLIFFLFENPKWMKALQDEVEIFRKTEIDVALIAKLPVLNAIIQETQRVVAVVPSKSQRVVQPEGIVLAGEFIPGGSHVSIPQQAVMKDPRNFSPSPELWRPDRWLNPEKEEAMDIKAHIPFSTGPFNCAGRLIALLELRYFATQFALNFNGRIAPGFDKVAFMDGVLDRFTVQKGPLMVELQKRK